MKLYSKNIICIILPIVISTSIHASFFTSWKEFPTDPIYGPFISSSLPDDYFPFVIFNNHKFNSHGDAVFYKMWHQGPNGIALSYSDDGIHWTLKGEVIIDPNTAFHPTVIYSKKGFSGGIYHYQLWYWTGNASPTPPALAIKFAQSFDGVSWTGPVATTQDATFFLSDVTAASTPFHQMYGFGQVIYNNSATSIPGQPFTFPYIAFFDSSAAELPPFTSQEAVGLAYSSDGIHWIRFGINAVLIPSGDVADWDGKYAFRAAVIKLDNIYHMFYSGSNGLSDIGLAYAHGIGHASSIDGITWTKDSNNPIFITTQGIPWRINHVLAPTVIIAPCLLQMWFSGGDSEISGGPDDKKIGYATLPNPIICFDNMWFKKSLIFNDIE